MMVRITLTACCLLAWFGNLVAQPYQDFAEIKRTVSQFVSEQLRLDASEHQEVVIKQPVSVHPVKPCQSTLKAFTPHGINNILYARQIGVRCMDDVSWSLYIPVEIHVYTPVVVAAKDIERGQSIVADLISVVEKDKRYLHHGYYSQLESVTGKVAKRRIRANALLTPSLVDAKIVIRRNQVVNVVLHANHIAIKTKGIALNDARLGESVNIKNLTSKKRMLGIAKASGQVEIN